MFHTETKKYGPVDVHLLYYENFVTSEHEHNLLPGEFKRLQQLKHPARRREFVATRVLRTLVFGNDPIHYSVLGAPYIEGEGFISISHAPHVVGLATCTDFPVGLDLEPIRSKVLRVKHKFLSANESASLDTESVVEMIKVWSGKEALYKLAGRKAIIFKESLLLTKINAEHWDGRICFPESKRNVTMNIEQSNDFVISVNRGAPCYEE